METDTGNTGNGAVMKVSEYVDALEEAGRGLAEAAARAGVDAEVPTCPGWRVRDLLRHTAAVHRWAAKHVVERHASYQEGEGETGLDGEALVAHYRESHAALVGALRAAPEDLDVWTFLPAPSPLAFWARRQAHETAVHRVDAEAALGAEPAPVSPGFAADGVSELLAGFHARDRSRVRVPEPRALRFRATDTGDAWTVRLSELPPVTEHHPAGGAGLPGPVDAEAAAPAGTLYLALWNRLPASALTATGDPEPLRLWHELSAV